MIYCSGNVFTILFFHSISKTVSAYLNLSTTMPSIIVSLLKLLLDFTYSLIEIVIKIVYIFLLFVFNIFGYLLHLLSVACPCICRITSAIYSISFWIMTQVLTGIIGQGNMATNISSWMLVLSIAFLYFEKRHRPDERLKQNKNINHMNETIGMAPAIQENEADIILFRDTGNSQGSDELSEDETIYNNDDDHHDNDDNGDNETNLAEDEGGLSDVSNEQTDLENREIETEENTQEETDHLRMHSNRNSNNSLMYRHTNVMQDLDRTLCSICFERDRNVAVFPCGHIHMCFECMQLVQQGNNLCPFCQRQIEDYKHVFF